MSDSTDQAQQADEFFTAMALKKPRYLETATFTGFCLNCEEPVDYPRRWCDADCRDDWQKEQ